MKYIYIVKNLIKNNIILNILFFIELVMVLIFLVFSLTRITLESSMNDYNSKMFDKTAIIMPDIFVQESISDENIPDELSAKIIDDYYLKLSKIIDNNTKLSQIDVFDIRIDGKDGLMITYDANTLKLLGYDNLQSNEAILLKSNKFDNEKKFYTIVPSSWVNEKEINYKNRKVNIIETKKFSGKIFYPGYTQYTNNILHINEVYIEPEVDFVVVMKTQDDLPASKNLSRVVYYKNENYLNINELNEIGPSKSFGNIYQSSLLLDKEEINQTLSLDIPVYITTFITFVAISFMNINRQRKNFNNYRIFGARKDDLIISYFLYLSLMFILALFFAKLIISSNLFNFVYDEYLLYFIFLTVFLITILISVYPIKALTKFSIIHLRKE
ncbi:hypothetical protein OKW22_000088 [Bacilli bacterium PM5-3]|nr:hypothetical protein [Bacilli bacterium PM5-3]